MEEIERLRQLSEKEAMDDKLRREISSALLEALPDGIIVADENLSIFQVNREAELIFGYARKEMLGQSVNVLLPERLREAHGKHLTRYIQEPRTRPMGTSGMQLIGRRKDGSEFGVKISLSPLPTERGLFVISLVRRHNAE